MTSLLRLISVVLVSVIALSGCSDDDDSFGSVIFVDADNDSGTEDGSMAFPFTDIQEALDSIVGGQEVYIFAATDGYVGNEMAIIDANTAEVIWYNRNPQKKMFYNPTSAKSVAKLCKKLLKEFIDP